jgi:hypothetical protein
MKHAKHSWKWFERQSQKLDYGKRLSPLEYSISSHCHGKQSIIRNSIQVSRRPSAFLNTNPPSLPPFHARDDRLYL